MILKFKKCLDEAKECEEINLRLDFFSKDSKCHSLRNWNFLADLRNWNFPISRPHRD